MHLVAHPDNRHRRAVFQLVATLSAHRRREIARKLPGSDSAETSIISFDLDHAVVGGCGIGGREDFDANLGGARQKGNVLANLIPTGIKPTDIATVRMSFQRNRTFFKIFLRVWSSGGV
jgi:hypothetical protein